MRPERCKQQEKKSKNFSSREKNVIKMSPLGRKASFIATPHNVNGEKHKRRAVLASVSEVAEDDVAFDHKKPLAPRDALHTEEN